jgi:carbon-monoxide dehydrogenase medium subunit
MKRLEPFRYHEPTTVAEAIDCLITGGRDPQILAGGTDLLVRMKRGQIRPSDLVNLKRIGGLDGIDPHPGQGLHIGALATIAAIERAVPVRTHFSVLAQAAASLGAPAIRNLATIGGNVGRASPASDMFPALIVLDARVIFEGPGGRKELPAEEICSGPGATCLGPGEIITGFWVPEQDPGARGVYLKIGRRSGMDLALVGVAVWLVLDAHGRQAREARVALPAVGPVPLRARRTEACLKAGDLTPERILEAARCAVEESSPVSDIRAGAAYRRELIAVLVRRAVAAILSPDRPA